MIHGKYSLTTEEMPPFVFHLAEPGKSFGEIALLTKGSVRNASIIVDEETDFLVVHRDLFNRCLKVYTSFPIIKGYTS